MGTLTDQKLRPVGRKNHGYRTTSFSRHGLNILLKLTRTGIYLHQPVVRLVERLVDWLARRLLSLRLTK
ncbi:MAG: hypothetical protein EOO60_03780 [Hymenobacter sp.]|nr:MAG: hypothetical protein EOO60_03780 [Hymenobacter sp.]